MEATKPAEKFWIDLPPDARMRILNNAYCVACRKGCSMSLERMSVQKRNLILEGRCTTCGCDVRRLVEGT